MLPEQFCERMKKMLGEEYNAFVTSLEQEKYQALRINPLKRNRNTNETEKKMVTEPGEYQIMAGISVENIMLTGSVTF